MTETQPLPPLAAQLLSDATEGFAEAVNNFCAGPASEEGAQVVEGFRQAVRLANAGHLLHMEADPAYPLLIKMQSLQRQMMLPSADAVYHYARLHGDYSYRLQGERGTAQLFQIAVYRGSSAYYPDFELSFDLDSVGGGLLGPGEQLDLVLSAQPRPELGEHWVPLPEGDCELHIRQYYYDWAAEQPASLMIEREQADYPPPVLRESEIVERAERMNSWLRVQSGLARQYVQSFLDADPATMSAISIPGAFEGTRYLNGHYRCGLDEAVILEVECPEALYWGFQLSNLSWEALDYYQRQTSLNGCQAVLDEDGRFRAVISHRDPGVANWLDAGGRLLGLISGRYFQASTAPEPRLHTVALEQLMDHLPAATARVSPHERAQLLRDRWRSVHHRLCSDQ